MSDTYHLIRNVNGGTVLDVKDGSKEPGASIIIYQRKPYDQNDNQRWLFKDGFLISKHSGLVIEVPMNKGHVEPGTPLIQAQKRDTDNKNQLWKYDEKDYRIRSEVNDGLCICGQDKNVKPGTTAIVDILDEMLPGNQEWMFDLP